MDGMTFTDDGTFDQLEAARCQRLWRAVVSRAIEDALGTQAGTYSPGSRATAIRDARKWIRSGPSFHEVCYMAGYDAPETLRPVLIAMVNEAEVKEQEGVDNV
ncbi:MAG: hypothetical protein H6905_01840 [Hyphomicrobiales bacterium]|nr:hypothetical protein [Hyphomicrobiales bacterium]